MTGDWTVKKDWRQVQENGRPNLLQGPSQAKSRAPRKIPSGAPEWTFVASTDFDGEASRHGHPAAVRTLNRYLLARHSPGQQTKVASSCFIRGACNNFPTPISHNNMSRSPSKLLHYVYSQKSVKSSTRICASCHHPPACSATYDPVISVQTRRPRNYGQYSREAARSWRRVGRGSDGTGLEAPQRAPPRGMSLPL